MSSHIACPGVVPSYLLARLAESGRYPRAAAAARQTLTAGRPRSAPASICRSTRTATWSPSSPMPRTARSATRATRRRSPVRSCAVKTTNPSPTPPSTRRSTDSAPRSRCCLAFGRNSLNDAGAPLDATVHYGTDYDNAFWDGERMVFGDGDGEVFVGFTASTTVIGHELAHGVVQYTANLEYQGQPGALNESIADVFGSDRAVPPGAERG